MPMYRTAYGNRLKNSVTARTLANSRRDFFIAIGVAAASDALQLSDSKPQHRQQQHAMPPAPDIGRSVLSIAVTYGDVDDLQVQLAGAEQQIEITERIEVAEHPPVGDDAAVVASPQNLRPAERIFNGLSQHP